MSLLVPDSGLLFWMLLSFGVVFIILAKYGFPVIVKMVESRKDYIDQSLDAAKEANRQLSAIKSESEAILAKAHEEQTKILNEAMATRDRIIQEAKEQARLAGQKQLEEAKRQIAAEKEEAIRDLEQEMSRFIAGKYEPLIESARRGEPLVLKFKTAEVAKTIEKRLFYN